METAKMDYSLAPAFRLLFSRVESLEKQNDKIIAQNEEIRAMNLRLLSAVGKPDKERQRVIPISDVYEIVRDVVINAYSVPADSYRANMKKRTHQYVICRQCITYILFLEFGFDDWEIAEIFGQDRTTSISSRERFSDLLETERRTKKIYDSIIRDVRDAYSEKFGG